MTDLSQSARVVTLVSTLTAARSLDLTDRHVRRLVADGELVNHGTPRRILLHIREVEEYEATRRHARLRRFVTT